MSTEPEKPSSDGREMLKLFGPHVAVAAFALVLGVAGVLYALKRPGKDSAGALACPASSLAAAARIAPLARGEMAALKVDKTPQPAPELTFEGPDGAPMTLASRRGRTILVNLWATWCPPCRKEMPALNELQKEMGAPDFEVVAINLDTRNLDKRKAFLTEIGATSLTFYADPGGKILPQMRVSAGVLGLPTTFLVDSAGCRLGLMQGEANWSSPEAKALLRAASGS
jgi:thiol-disulfide isomerase/thioredoxin